MTFGLIQKIKRLPLLFWAFLACSVVRFLAVVPFVIDDDEAWWAVSARWLKHPWDFYRSVPDDKTPGSVWFAWVVREVFGNLGADPRVIRAVYIAFTIGCALLLGRIAEKYFRQSKNAFWISGILFLIASVLPSPKLLAFTGDGLMALYVICGYSLALFASSSITGLLALFFSGAFLASAVLVKQTAIFAAIPILFSRFPRKWRISEIAVIALGALAVLIPSIWALGLQDTIFWSWTYPREVLTAVRGETFAGESELWTNTLLFLISLLPLTVAAFRFKTHRSSPLFDFRVLWLISGLFVIFTGKGLFLHYYLMAVPPIALMLAEVFSRKKLRIWEGLWLGLGYVACCFLVTVPALQVTWGTDLPYFSRLQTALGPALKPDDSVLFWGGSPLPLAYSGARPVTRFFLPRYAVAPYGTEKTHEVYEAELSKDPPSVIIDLHERGDNRFGNPLESEPKIASLIDDYDLYVAPGVPWAKFYFRNPPPASAHLVRVRSERMREQVYASYPSVNPAWKPFEKLIQQPPTFSTLKELTQLESTLRTEHALELIALHSVDVKKRNLALKLARKIRDAASSQERALASIEADRFLAESRERRDVLPLNTPEWWFTVSLTQMQPRVAPQKLASESEAQIYR